MDKIQIPENILSSMIEDYIENKLSIDKIVNKYGYSNWTIRRRFVDSGVTIRHRAALSKKYKLDAQYFKNIDSEEKAYWLGMMYADGSVYSSKKGCMFHLTLQEGDKCHIEKFKFALKTDAPIHTQHRNGNKQFGLFIWSKELYSYLIEAGCIEQKGAYIRMPSNNIVPAILKRHFIRGYYDGNGSPSWNEEKSRVTIKITTNCKFIDDLKILFSQELGVEKYYNDEIVEYQDYPSNYYSSIVFGRYKNIEKFYHYIYDGATVLLERKKLKLDNFIEYINK